MRGNAGVKGQRRLQSAEDGEGERPCKGGTGKITEYGGKAGAKVQIGRRQVQRWKGE